VAVIASPVEQNVLVFENRPKSSDVNLTEIVRQYMNFGADPGDVSGYNCTAWSRLWNEDGIRNTPGEPGSQGWAQLEKMCNDVRGQFGILYCDSQMEIDVMSWNTEKRTAFQWTINGILLSTGEQVSVPAISNLFMDPDGTIQKAWDWLDPTPFGVPTPVVRVNVDSAADLANLTEVARIYMNFGGFPNYPHAANCTQWAAQFGEYGTRNTPGTPPTKGLQQQLKRCQDVRGGFETMLNFAEELIPVTSWNAEQRVAFVWAIEGLLTNGKIIHRQAISSIFLWRNGTIQDSWDFLDPTDLP